MRRTLLTILGLLSLCHCVPFDKRDETETGPAPETKQYITAGNDPQLNATIQRVETILQLPRVPAAGSKGQVIYFLGVNGPDEHGIEVGMYTLISWAKRESRAGTTCEKVAEDEWCVYSTFSRADKQMDGEAFGWTGRYKSLKVVSRINAAAGYWTQVAVVGSSRKAEKKFSGNAKRFWQAGRMLSDGANFPYHPLFLRIGFYTNDSDSSFLDHIDVADKNIWMNPAEPSPMNNVFEMTATTTKPPEIPAYTDNGLGTFGRLQIKPPKISRL